MCGPLVTVVFTNATTLQNGSAVFACHAHAAKAVRALCPRAISRDIHSHANRERFRRPSDPTQADRGTKFNLPLYRVSATIRDVQKEKSMGVSKNEPGNRTAYLDTVFRVIKRCAGVMGDNRRTDQNHESKTRGNQYLAIHQYFLLLDIPDSLL
tara:strand:+ start:103 stop:564 length:462 start_codon:yes stop_codon:yes gene_type:complete